MPLRPATFAPPAVDRRAAAREKYLRALDEARRAKEEYADTLSDDELKKKRGSPPVSPVVETVSQPTPTSTDSADTPAPAAPADDAMVVDDAPPAVADVARARSPSCAPSPADPAPPAVSAPEPPKEKICSFTSWLKASMGVPSMFAVVLPKPADSRSNETTMPAPLPPSDTKHRADDDADDCASRRRAALSVASLASDKRASSASSRKPVWTDSAPPAGSRGPDPPRAGAPPPRYDEPPKYADAAYRGYRDVAASPPEPSSYRRLPTQQAPRPPPRRSSISDSDDGRPVLLPLRELEDRRSNYQPPALRDDWQRYSAARAPASLPSRFSQAAPPPPPRNAESHISLLAAAAATVEAGNLRGEYKPACGSKRHERDWDAGECERRERPRHAPEPYSGVRGPSPTPSRTAAYHQTHRLYQPVSSSSKPQHGFLALGGESVMPAPMDSDSNGTEVDMLDSPSSTIASEHSAPPAPVPAATVKQEPVQCELSRLSLDAKLTPAATQAAALQACARPRPPSPTPQRIPLFLCEGGMCSAAGSAAAAPSSSSSSATAATEPASDDPLAEIARVEATFATLKTASVFPAAASLDFSNAVWPAGFVRAAPANLAQLVVGPTVRLPVCARNLIVHAYDHALQKVLARLEGVSAARVRGVRDAKKRAVAGVRDEMRELERKVQVAAREWLVLHPEVVLPA